MTKYKNKKVYVNGILFDSRKEANRYIVLLDMQTQGLISDLQTQVKYVLIPAQFEPDKIGARGGKIKGKCLERECSYFADFRYFDNRTGENVVEDTKGFKTADYKIKRKLMLHVHGIRIKEI
jgi:hypothetical protein